MSEEQIGQAKPDVHRMSSSWIQIELTRPLLLVGLIALPLLAYYFYRSLVDFARWQMLASLIARATIIVLLVLSLAGLTLLKPTHEQFVIFAMDSSLSVGEESRKASEEFLNQAIASVGSNHVAFLPFAAQPGQVQTNRNDTQPPLDEKGTDLAAAIDDREATVVRVVSNRAVNVADHDRIHAAVAAALS